MMVPTCMKCGGPVVPGSNYCSKHQPGVTTKEYKNPPDNKPLKIEP
jgi:hypothetical protein